MSFNVSLFFSSSEVRSRSSRRKRKKDTMPFKFPALRHSKTDLQEAGSDDTAQKASRRKAMQDFIKATGAKIPRRGLTRKTKVWTLFSPICSEH